MATVASVASGLRFQTSDKAQGVIKFTKESDLNAVTIKKGTVIQTERINEIIYKLIVTEETEIKKRWIIRWSASDRRTSRQRLQPASGYYKILPEPITGVKAVENSENRLTTIGCRPWNRWRIKITLPCPICQRRTTSYWQRLPRHDCSSGRAFSRQNIFLNTTPPEDRTANAYLLLDTGRPHSHLLTKSTNTYKTATTVTAMISFVTPYQKQNTA